MQLKVQQKRQVKWPRDTHSDKHLAQRQFQKKVAPWEKITMSILFLKNIST